MMSQRDMLKAVDRPNHSETDYIKDGLRHCAVCHEPKQFRGETLNENAAGLILHRMCKCARDAQEQEEKEREQKQTRDLAERIHKEMLPSEKQRQCTFEAAEPSKAIDIAKKYVNNWPKFKADGTGLVFYGGVGTGKTYVALCIANALMQNPCTVRFWSAAEIVSKLSAKDTRQEEFFDKVQKAELVIIDDLGAEHSSDYAQSVICRVIDTRRESGKPFIVTTNYSPAELAAPKDPLKARTFDRVLGSCLPVEVSGESRRINERKERLEAARNFLF
jgi:DNA replication protein DnaC